MVKVLCSEPTKNTSAVFARPKTVPKGQEFVCAFYRLLDSGDLKAEAQSQLADLERHIFHVVSTSTVISLKVSHL